MKKIILIFLGYFTLINAFTQEASTKPSTSELTEVYKFIKDFKANYAVLTSSTSSKYINFPLKIENGSFNLETASSWATLSDDLKKYIQSLCNKIPENLELDKSYEVTDYKLKMNYDASKLSYRILVEYDDEDWTCEELWIKKSNNKFLVFEYCFYSLMDLF